MPLSESVCSSDLCKECQSLGISYNPLLLISRQNSLPAYYFILYLAYQCQAHFSAFLLHVRCNLAKQYFFHREKFATKKLVPFIDFYDQFEIYSDDIP